MKKMQMIHAIIRPGLESKVVESLETEGCISLTKMEVFGRGKQKGLHIQYFTNWIEKSFSFVHFKILFC